MAVSFFFEVGPGANLTALVLTMSCSCWLARILQLRAPIFGVHFICSVVSSESFWICLDVLQLQHVYLVKITWSTPVEIAFGLGDHIIRRMWRLIEKEARQRSKDDNGFRMQDTCHKTTRTWFIPGRRLIGLYNYTCSFPSAVCPTLMLAYSHHLKDLQFWYIICLSINMKWNWCWFLFNWVKVSRQSKEKLQQYWGISSA